jgi:rod shape-determining protein MreC
MTWFARNRSRLLVAGLFLFAFVLFQARLRSPHEQSWFDRSLVTITAPLQAAVVWLVDGSVELWDEYLWLVSVEQDNESQRVRLAELEREMAGWRACDAENRRLRALVKMAARMPEHSLVAARVIGLGTSPASHVIRIGVGSDDGIGQGDAVLGGAGLVGRVTGVTAGAAEVQLLTDVRSAVDVISQRSRAHGILRGQGQNERCLLDHLVRTADVAEGDVVVSSGIGGTVPPGLPVGTIASVTAPRVGVFRKAEIAPTVDFDLLEEVLVITRKARQAGQDEVVP